MPLNGPIELAVPGRTFATTLWRGGEGPPLVFLHGAGGLSPRDPFLARLAERFEVIAPVHPGFGDISDLDDLEDVHDLALYHDDLLGALGLEHASVAGHSFGGMIAAELAAHVPARVANLVLIAPVGLWRDEAPMADLLSTEPEQVPALLWADPSGPTAAEVASALADPGQSPVDQAVQASRGITAATKYLWPIPDHGLSRRLYRIRSRTLVLWGAEDRLISASYADDFARGIADCRVEVLEKAGHHVTYEQLDRCAELVSRLLTGSE
ncbi:MAG: alpha/beta hydrolase [Acidimicrobiales bacterium]|nr:alpha/beta hydrolase [Acidimicrobiales bacterium]MBO0886096.1 alpha/beta hydrolase [Acidimicrobiales bacterium]MBO0893060.1 alpha/beta hydrolase [Acidimicrobiales bacterium]